MKKCREFMKRCGLLLLLCLIWVLPARADGSVNRFNVVFVVDGSGSMKYTDANSWRYEAIDQFLALLTDAGNNVGFVVFDDGIIAQSNIQAVTGTASKKTISQQLRDSGTDGDTNIGGAIELATTMLQQQGDASLNSVIILLSDGNTDLPNDADGSQLAAAEASKANAIQVARDNGYSIYGICLNANGAANPAELQDIASATGGGFAEVTNAEDLQTVFQEFYTMIYGTSTISLWNDPIPESGVLELPFEVPAVGVEEVNIIVNNTTSLSNIALYQPSGIAYTSEEIEAMTMDGENFTVIKVAAPQAGAWKLTANGVPGDSIKIDLVFNANITLSLASTDGTAEYMLGGTMNLTAGLLADGTAVADAAMYQSYAATLYVQKPDGTVTETPMSAAGAGYVASVAADQSGTYQVWAEASDGSVSGSSDMLTLTVGDLALVLQTANGAAEYAAGSTVTVNGYIQSNGANIADMTQYQNTPAVLHVQKPDGTVEDVAMSVGTDSYTASFVADSLGNYIVWADASASSGQLGITITNAAPVLSSDTLTQKIITLPFGSKTQTVSLADAAEDPEGQALTWKVTASPYEEDAVTVAGDTVSISKNSVGKGEVTLTVSDPYGASADLTLKLSVINGTLIIIVVAVAVLVVILLIVLLVMMKKKNQRFNGDITVTSFDYGPNGMGPGLPNSGSPGRGTSDLRLYVQDGCGIQIKGSKFVATGKGYILFQSAKGYYSSSNPGKREKKIRIDPDFEVTISNTQELESGITVLYSPVNFGN